MNKEKYEGKTVKILNKETGRLVSRLHVTQVLEEEILYGFVPESEDFWTAYYLSDNILVAIEEEPTC